MRTDKASRVRRALLAGTAALVAAVVVPVAAIATSSPGDEAAPVLISADDAPGTGAAASSGSAPGTSSAPGETAGAVADPSRPPVAGSASQGSTPTAARPTTGRPSTPATTQPSTAPGSAPSAADPTAPPAALPAPPAVPVDADPPTQGAVRLISPYDTGAVGDGVTDDSLALQAAFDLAGDGDVVMLPAGATFAHSRVLTVRRGGMTLTGGGTLRATREATSSLTVSAPGVTVSGITLTVASTTRRWDAYEQQRLRLDGATGAVVRNVVVDGSAAAGVYVGGGTSGFVLDRVTVMNTRADGIHITQGSHDGQVVSPVVRNVGDDGVAVVSYRQDGVPCARIVVTSPSVDGSTGGRGLSVVGGTDVDFTGIDVRNTYGAGVYLAAEGGWGTAGVARVRVSGGAIVNANAATSIDHGSVLVYNGTPDQLVSDVTLTGLTVSGYRASVSRVLGLIVDSASSPGIRNATLSGIAITGDGRPAALVSNQSSTTFAVTSVLRNGAGLVRTGGYFR
ncbi:Pectate lyase superfamily protein [Klenkia marina]|uniref:Pectate lyase superfamily protein n=1 Tax=Klenkia marina TaxID=1960309 RepID=A0A1G4XFU6_9ACTN|nr:glycosyl hydrolase family 28-related protein [Klenkia marina]SCX40122.1 Pectate lyase superfamily protein [Klenkia marina]